MAKYAYPNVTCVVHYSGGTARITRGQAWLAHHPVVREHPDMFSSEPVIVHGTDVGDPVEDATAEPGKKRTTRAK